jgi:hypothetical protein
VPTNPEFDSGRGILKWTKTGLLAFTPVCMLRKELKFKIGLYYDQ